MDIRKVGNGLAAGLGATTIVVLGAYLLAPQYDTHRAWSDDPADTGGRSKVVSADWPIAAEADAERPKIESVLTVGPRGIVEGGQLRVVLGTLLPTEQRLYIPFSLTVSSAFFFDINMLRDAKVETTAKGVRLELEEPSPASHFANILKYIKYKRGDGAKSRDNLMRQIDNEFAVRIRVVGGKLSPGDEVRIVLGATGGLEPPPREAQWQVVWAVDGDADGTFGLVEDAEFFVARSTKVSAVRLIAPTTMKAGDTARAVIRVEDDYFLPNLAAFDAGTVALKPIDGIANPTTLQLRGRSSTDRRREMSAWEGSVAEFELTANVPGVYRLEGTATIDGRELPVRSNPILVDETEPNVYFGDTHLHSILSYDADRAPNYVYWRQKHQERHDFAFLSDHDMIGNPGFVDKTGLAGRTPDEWAYIVRLADEWYRPGEFVTLRAHEWTSYYYGHRNVYFGPGEKAPKMTHHNQRSGDGPDDSRTPGELRDDIQGRDILVIPHSTAWPTAGVQYAWGGGGGRFGKPAEFQQQRLLELYSTHGTSEYFDNEYAVDEGRPEAPTDSAVVKALMNYDIKQAGPDSGNFAQDALAAGWRFGFLGSSDMHFLSHLDQAYKYGFAAVVADELTRESIWAAMKARRTYATTGVRLYLDFTANGSPMGSEIPAGGPVEFTGRFLGTADIDRVQVVKYDGKAYSLLFDEAASGPDWKGTIDDESGVPGSFYYLKVRQKDGNYAWSSPIWLIDQKG